MDAYTPISSLPFELISRARLPSAISSAILAICAGSPPNCLRIPLVITIPRSAPRMMENRDTANRRKTALFLAARPAAFADAISSPAYSSTLVSRTAASSPVPSSSSMALLAAAAAAIKVPCFSSMEAAASWKSAWALSSCSTSSISSGSTSL